MFSNMDSIQQQYNIADGCDIAQPITKLCIKIDSNTPIIMKLPMPANCITLSQFKEYTSLDHHSCKFFFESRDPEFGLVKEEVINDDSFLPADGDRIVAQVISDKSNRSSLFEEPINVCDRSISPQSSNHYSIGSNNEPRNHMTPGRDFVSNFYKMPQHSPRSICHQETLNSPATNIDLDRLPIPVFGDEVSSSGRRHHYPHATRPVPQIPSSSLDRKVFPNIKTHSLPRSTSPNSNYANQSIDHLSDYMDNTSAIQTYNNSQQRLMASQSSSTYESPALYANDDLHNIYRALKNDAKNLDIKDREWLRVTIKEAFIGSSLIKWLSNNVTGFNNKKEIKQLAHKMLGSGLIKSPMLNSNSFSEKCYYTLS